MKSPHISATLPHLFITFPTLLPIIHFSNLMQISSSVVTPYSNVKQRQHHHSKMLPRHHHLVASTAAISSCVSPPFNVRRTVHATGNVCPLTHSIHVHIHSFTQPSYQPFSSLTWAGQWFPESLQEHRSG